MDILGYDLREKLHESTRALVYTKDQWIGIGQKGQGSTFHVRMPSQPTKADGPA